MNIETRLGIDHTYTLALDSMRKNKYGDASRMLEYIVGTDPQNPPAFLSLAICYIALADGSEGPQTTPEDSRNYHKKAISATQKALQLLQDAAEPYQHP